MRIHIYFIHQFVLVFDAQDQFVGRQVGIAVDDGSVGIIAISPDKGRASGQQGGTENNKQIEGIFFWHQQPPLQDVFVVWLICVFFRFRNFDFVDFGTGVNINF